MARKSSSSHRRSRTSGAVSHGGRTRRPSAPRRAHDTKRGKTGRPDRAKHSDKLVSPPGQPTSRRARSGRAPARRSSAASRRAGGPNHTANPVHLRAAGTNGASEQVEKRLRLRGGLGPAKASDARRRTGRGHRRNFDESDDGTPTRGRNSADATSDKRDPAVRPRTRAADESVPRSRFPSCGGRSAGFRSDW